MKFRAKQGHRHMANDEFVYIHLGWDSLEYLASLISSRALSSWIYINWTSHERKVSFVTQTCPENLQLISILEEMIK